MFVMGEVLRHLDAGPTKQAGLAAALPGLWPRYGPVAGSTIASRFS